ncbi:hemolysin family protein [Flammeovirgaceae bacterium SG7u.111]|nr:hemolysin family protein [Flammeovirgaceae bacterium SG7u.132]WPO36220.1 hemolysin family protein [Flammeovirgaceae bacterium SG7u.111]
MSIELKLVILSLIFSGFFSAVEIAFVSANRLHIEIQRKNGLLAGRLLSKFVDNPSYFISTTLLGNTISLVVYGYFFAKLLEPSIEFFLTEQLGISGTSTITTLVLIIQTCLSTSLVLATAEFLPKSIALVDPDKLLSIAVFPMTVVYYVFFPIVWVVVILSKLLITKLLKLEYNEQKQAFGLTDLNNYIMNLREDLGKNDESSPDVDQQIFSNALEFKRVKVRDCMIPRKEIVAIEDNEPIEELKKIFVDTGLSKVLIYKDSIDNIIGYCHHLDLFKKPKKIAEVTNEIVIVPETMLANELMIKFISERKSIALVVDEFGGTSGIVTIEDIMEEIFGDIVDEYDDEDLLFKKIDENTFLLSARNEIDDLNEEYKFIIPEGDYDTLGGYILHINEDIPELQDVVENDQFSFEIISKDGARIDKVKMTIKNPETKSDQ